MQLSDEGYFSKQVLKALGNQKRELKKKGENRPTWLNIWTKNRQLMCKISENLYYTSCFLSWRFPMEFRLILVSRTTFKEIWRLVEKNPPKNECVCVCVWGGGVNDDPSFCTPWIRFVAKKNHMQKRIKIYIYMYYTDGIEKKWVQNKKGLMLHPLSRDIYSLYVQGRESISILSWS